MLFLNQRQRDIPTIVQAKPCIVYHRAASSCGHFRPGNGGGAEKNRGGTETSNVAGKGIAGKIKSRTWAMQYQNANKFLRSAIPCACRAGNGRRNWNAPFFSTLRSWENAEARFTVICAHAARPDAAEGQVRGSRCA